MSKFKYLKLNKSHQHIAEWLFAKTLERQESDPIVDPKHFNEELFEHFCHQVSTICPNEESAGSQLGATDLFLEDLWDAMEKFEFAKLPLADQIEGGKTIREQITEGVRQLEVTIALLNKIQMDGCPKQVQTQINDVLPWLRVKLDVERASLKEMSTGGPKIEIAEMDAVFLLYRLFDFCLLYEAPEVPRKILSFYPQGLEKVSRDGYCKITPYRLIMNLAATIGTFLTEQVVRKRFHYTNSWCDPITGAPHVWPNSFPKLILEGARKEYRKKMVGRRKRKSA